MNGKEKVGLNEVKRFLIWAIENKDSMQKLIELYAKEEISEDDEWVIHDMEREYFFQIIIYILIAKDKSQSIGNYFKNINKETLIDKWDDWYIYGLIDNITSDLKAKRENISKKECMEETISFLKNYDKGLDCIKSEDYLYMSFYEWMSEEWYEWEYICSAPEPDKNTIIQLEKKLRRLSAGDDKFGIAHNLILTRFFDKDDDGKYRTKDCIEAIELIRMKYK